MKPVINVSQLSKHYIDFSLKSVSFSIPSGYITGFIGPNGSGKTTTSNLFLILSI